jgi:hypothetical protein
MNFTHPFYPRDNTFYKGFGGKLDPVLTGFVAKKASSNADVVARLMGKSIAGDAMKTGSYDGSVERMASIAPGRNLLEEIKKQQGGATLLG